MSTPTPTPSFFARIGLAFRVRPQIPLETSRGCWWGMKHHCIFCGLNGKQMAFQDKSPDRVAQWFETPASTLLVAERDGEIAAVGGYFATSRTVSLNYVSPRHRFAGVSSALLSAIESGLGPGEANLESTQTARRFYESRGWHITGDLAPHRGIEGYPMRKLLS